MKMNKATFKIETKNDGKLSELQQYEDENGTLHFILKVPEEVGISHKVDCSPIYKQHQHLFE